MGIALGTNISWVKNPCPLIHPRHTLPPAKRCVYDVANVYNSTVYYVHECLMLLLFIPDIDECSTLNGGCHHQCNNSIGTFECGCDDGFELDTSDDQTCTGILQCLIVNFKSES